VLILCIKHTPQAVAASDSTAPYYGRVWTNWIYLGGKDWNRPHPWFRRLSTASL